MLTLHRGIADILGAISEGTRRVFFECLPGQSPAARLTGLLAQVWQVPVEQIEVYNVLSEREMLDEWALGEQGTGDARLLETGWDGTRVLYAEPSTTVVLASPHAAARIAAAQALVEQLSRLCLAA